MMVANTNTNLSFTDSIVTDCSSTGFGGGLRLSSDNLAIRVSNVSFTATSGSSGGAVFVIIMQFSQVRSYVATLPVPKVAVFMLDRTIIK